MLNIFFSENLAFEIIKKDDKGFLNGFNHFTIEVGINIKNQYSQNCHQIRIKTFSV